MATRPSPSTSTSTSSSSSSIPKVRLPSHYSSWAQPTSSKKESSKRMSTLSTPSSSSSSRGSSSTDFDAPPHSWLAGTWHVTHSTQHTWRSKRNVRVAFTELPRSDQLHDLLTYDKPNASKPQSVHGVSTSRGDGVYTRASCKGLRRMVGCRWEILGWGAGLAAPATADADAFMTGVHDPADTDEWIVMYCAKTLLTPARIDIASRHEGGLSNATLNRIRKSLLRLDLRVRTVSFESARLSGDWMGSWENQQRRDLFDGRGEVGRLTAQLFRLDRDMDCQA